MYVNYVGKFYRVLHPRPTLIIGSICKDGKVNFMPASWNTPVSEEPPTVAVVVDKESYTNECLRENPQATLNVPSQEQLQLTYELGSVSGRDVDKVSKFKLELIPSTSIKVPGLKGSIAIMECEVMKVFEIGEVFLYVFKVLNVKVAKDLVDEYSIDFSKTNILLHGAGRVFYLVNPKKLFAKKPT